MHVDFSPDANAEADIEFSDFMKVDIRVGTIIEATPFPKARKASYQLKIDFGPGIGVKASSAQITTLYGLDNLVGRQVLAVVNFPPRQIANFMSEVLTLGFSNPDGAIVLAKPDTAVPNGARLI